MMCRSGQTPATRVMAALRRSRSRSARRDRTYAISISFSSVRATTMPYGFALGIRSGGLNLLPFGQSETPDAPWCGGTVGSSEMFADASAVDLLTLSKQTSFRLVANRRTEPCLHARPAPAVACGRPGFIATRGTERVPLSAVRVLEVGAKSGSATQYLACLGSLSAVTVAPLSGDRRGARC